MDEKNKGGFSAFLKRKDIEISWKRYFIDAMGAMASGLFASLLIGTILSTLGTQLGIRSVFDSRLRNKDQIEN